MATLSWWISTGKQHVAFMATSLILTLVSTFFSVNPKNDGKEIEGTWIMEEAVERQTSNCRKVVNQL
jgi:hypothetical protein